MSGVHDPDLWMEVLDNSLLSYKTDEFPFSPFNQPSVICLWHQLIVDQHLKQFCVLCLVISVSLRGVND